MQSKSSNDLSDKAYVARRLRSKKTLVVLDDVNNSTQLTNLQEKICNYLAEGSKVIITTRDKQLLMAHDYEIHEANGLSYDHSRQLFISKAFQQGHSKDGYEQLIEKFVHYTQHIPLASKFLGSFVCSKDKKFWDSLLEKLRDGSPNGEIQEVLRVSYNGLDDEEKKIFLEIACFLKGESEEFVEDLLKSYGFRPTIGIERLKDKALIIVTTSGKVGMHDLIQEMGYRIAREENIDELGKRSRLWDPKEIYNVLKNCEGKKVEGIMFYSSAIERLELAADTFNNMKKLRFLKIRSRYSFDMTSNISVPTTGLKSISSKIRYFYWLRYPGNSLPSNFCAKLLLKLNLTWSLVETLWEGVQDLANLRRLKLRWCKKLRELPDFSNASRLESVDLSGCGSLRYVPESLLCLHSLIRLNVSFCSSLESLQSTIHLKSLKQVDTYCCINLKEFSVSSGELTSLNLSDTKIEELRPSTGRCSKLRTLYLPGYIRFKNLPTEVLSCLTYLEVFKIYEDVKDDNEGLRVLFDHLHSVQSLEFNGSKNLKELPDNITKLSGLKDLHLDDCFSLTKLPDNMRHLSQLQLLSVQHCRALQNLPKLPPSLRILAANYCTSLERVSASTISSTPHNYGEKFFSFIDCVKLDLGAIEEQAKLLSQNAVREKEDIQIHYPGEKVPKWFGEYRTQHDSFTLHLSLSSHNLLGFVFCAVLPIGAEAAQLDLSVTVEGGEMIRDVVFPSKLKFCDKNFYVMRTHCRAGNVLLCTSPELSKPILEKIEGNRRNHGATTCNPNVLFEFHAQIYPFSREPMRGCGVYPIYASECSDLNFHSRKCKAI